MDYCSRRVIIFLAFIGFISIQTDKVYGLKSLDLAPRWVQGEPVFRRNSRILKADEVAILNLSPSSAPSTAMSFDPNESSKRRFQRGSDPVVFMNSGLN